MSEGGHIGALEREDLLCMCLAHHELESAMIIQSYYYYILYYIVLFIGMIGWLTGLTVFLHHL